LKIEGINKKTAKNPKGSIAVFLSKTTHDFNRDSSCSYYVLQTLLMALAASWRFAGSANMALSVVFIFFSAWRQHCVISKLVIGNLSVARALRK